VDLESKPACAHKEHTTMRESYEGALGIPEFMPPNRRRTFKVKSMGSENKDQ
jgi:hypothetical protein